MTGYIPYIRKMVGKACVMIAGAGVIIHKGRQVLLQQRRDNATWGIHGGCVDIGEEVEAAARRELFEETGLTAHTLKLLGVFSGPRMMHTYPNGDEVSIVGITYTCDDFSGEMLPESDETLALEWFDCDRLPAEINSCDRPMLEAFAQLRREG